MKRTKETLLTLRKEQLSATTRLSVMENHQLKRELDFQTRQTEAIVI